VALLLTELQGGAGGCVQPQHGVCFIVSGPWLWQERARQGRAGLFLGVCRAQAEQEQEPGFPGLLQNTGGKKQLLL